MLTPNGESANLGTLSSSDFSRFFSSVPDCRISASGEENFRKFGSSDVVWYKIGLSESTWTEERDVREGFLRPEAGSFGPQRGHERGE